MHIYPNLWKLFISKTHFQDIDSILLLFIILMDQWYGDVITCTCAKLE